MAYVEPLHGHQGHVGILLHGGPRLQHPERLPGAVGRRSFGVGDLGNAQTEAELKLGDEGFASTAPTPVLLVQRS